VPGKLGSSAGWRLITRPGKVEEDRRQQAHESGQNNDVDSVFVEGSDEARSKSSREGSHGGKQNALDAEFLARLSTGAPGLLQIMTPNSAGANSPVAGPRRVQRSWIRDQRPILPTRTVIPLSFYLYVFFGIFGRRNQKVAPPSGVRLRSRRHGARRACARWQGKPGTFSPPVGRCTERAYLTNSRAFLPGGLRAPCRRSRPGRTRIPRGSG